MQYTELLEKQIITRLKADNPWWTEGRIPDYYAKMQPRLYFERFFGIATDTEIDRAMVLMGPRRVGKTVMMYHTIQKLINQGVNPQNIIYASIETPIYLDVYLEFIFNLARRALGKKENDRNERFYVFFDEIQYLKNWEINLKSLVDTYKQCKFVVSGSAAAALRKGSAESGAGRFTDFKLPPLTFYEYVKMNSYGSIMFKNEGDDYYSTIDIQKLNRMFINYINYGGYPEIVFSVKTRENTELFIKHDIIEKVLLKDLPGIYGVSDSQELNSLFTMIAYNSGNQFSYEKLAQESGIKKDTLKKYIQYLEVSFLVTRIRRADHTAKNYKRETAFKLYLTNPSLRCALFEAEEPQGEFIGNMVETAIFAQLTNSQDIAYANWNGHNEGEVDLVAFDPATQKPRSLVEIKWTDKPFDNPSVLKSLEYFMELNQIGSAVVTSLTAQGSKTMNFGTLKYVPSACYAYTLGESIVTKNNNYL